MIFPLSSESSFEFFGLPLAPASAPLLLALFTLLTLPALLRTSARTEAVGYAIHCCLAQMLGVLLMSAAALPALHTVFAGEPLAEAAYLGLLFTFAIGGLLFLWNDARLRTIDPAARAIPMTLFFITWKFIGLLAVVFGVLSFVLHAMMETSRTDAWWVTDCIMLLYGLILSWFTLHRGNARSRPIGAVKSTAALAAAHPQNAKKAPKQAKGKR